MSVTETTTNKQTKSQCDMLMTGSLSFPLRPRYETWTDRRQRLAACALAACCAEAVSIPFETIKVRVHMTGELQPYHRGHLGQVIALLSHEGSYGMSAFYKGLSVGLVRQALGAPLRMLVYAELKERFQDDETGDMSWSGRLVAGFASTITTHAVMNPLSFLKIRMQYNQPNHFPRYYSSVDAIRKIWAKEGPRAFGSGLVPNLIRNSSLHVTELLTYDAIKKHALNIGMEDSVALHCGAGIGAGLVAAFVCNPFDVLKTRMMCQKSFNIRKYNSALDAATKILTKEGISGFYKGLYPQLVRLAVWNGVMFTVYEELMTMRRPDENE